MQSYADDLSGVYIHVGVSRYVSHLMMDTVEELSSSLAGIDTIS